LLCHLLNSCLFTAAEKLFGYSRGEVVKQNVRMLMPNEVAEHHGELLASCPLQAT
jgi:PAS domain S-box-containing protein